MRPECSDEHRGTVDSASAVLYPCLRVRVRVVGDLALGGFELQTAPCCCSGCIHAGRLERLDEALWGLLAALAAHGDLEAVQCDGGGLRTR